MSTKPKQTDALTWARKHLGSIPPQAIAAFNRANSDKGKNMIAAASASPFAPMPAPTKPAIKTRDELQASILTPSVAAHVRAGLRNFRTVRAATDAVATLQEAVARMQGDYDSPGAAHLKARQLTPMAIATEASGPGGGFVVGDSVSAAIQLRMMEVGAARILPTQIPVGTERTAIPTLTTPPVPYYPSETEAITESTPAFGAVNATVRKRACTVKISAELLGDSAVALLDALVGSIANELSALEDSELVAGDGTSSFGGVSGLLQSLGSAGIYTPATGAGKSVWSGLAGADFAALVGKLPERYSRTSNKWLCSTPFWAVMMAALPAAVSHDAQARPYFMGRRVVLSEKMPRATATSQVSALYGAFEDACLFADRGIRTAVSDSGPALFAEDLAAIRVVSRYGIVCHNTGDGASAGAIVGLSTAAS